MKRKNAVIVIFLMLGLLLVSGGFFAGYFAIQNYFTIPETIRAFVKEYQKTGAAEAAGQNSSTGTVSVWLPQERISLLRLDLSCIYEEELKAVVVTALDCQAQTLTLYTVPLDTKLALTEEQYQEISAVYPALPQLFRLGILDNYLEPEEAARLLQQLFTAMFQCRIMSAAAVTVSDAGWLDCTEEICTFSAGVQEFFLRSPVNRNVFEYISEASKEKESSDTPSTEPSEDEETQGTVLDVSWLNYAESLAFLPAEACTAALLPGSRGNDGYQLQTDYIRQLWYPR